MKKINLVNMYTEFIFSTLSIIFIILLIVFQVVIKASITNSFALHTLFSEGIDLEVYQNYMTEGKVSISLENVHEYENIYILVNGKLVSAFHSSSIILNVRNNSLIEIDGRKIKKPFDAKITSFSKNIVVQNITYSVCVKSNIVLLFRTILKK